MDSWSRSFDTASALADEVEANLKERSQKALQGADVSQLTISARRKISHLETNCAQLEEELNTQTRDPITYRV